jgi:hypothetical protein
MSPYCLNEWRLVVTELNAGAELSCGAWNSLVRQRRRKLAGKVASHKAPPLACLLEDLVRQHGRDAEDEEPLSAIPEEARAGADGEEQHRVEPVAEHPRQQVKVLADVTDDPEQREAALVGAE